MCSYPYFGLSKIGFTSPSQLLKLIIFFKTKTVSLPMQKSATKTASLPIKKSAAKTASLPMQKSAAKTASLLIKKSTAKTTSLPMQKSAAKTALLPIKKSAAKTKSSILSIYIFFFFWVFTIILWARVLRICSMRIME